MAGARLATVLLALSQGYNNAAVGALVAQFALMQVFLSLPAGRFADRHGLKRPIAFSVIATTTGLCPSRRLAHLSRAVPVRATVRRRDRRGDHRVAAARCRDSGTDSCGLHVGRNSPSHGDRHRPGCRRLHHRPRGISCCVPHHGRMADRGMAGFEAEGPARGSGAKRSGTTWELLRVPYMSVPLLMNLFMSVSWELHAFMVAVLGHVRGLKCLADRHGPGLLRRRRRGDSECRAPVRLTGGRVVADHACGSVRRRAGNGLSVRSLDARDVRMFHANWHDTRLCAAHGAEHAAPNHTRRPAGRGPCDSHDDRERLSRDIPIVLGAVSAISGPAGVFWVMGMVSLAGSTLGSRLRGATRRDAAHVITWVGFIGWN